MVVLQFHVTVETLRELRTEANATGKTISEVSRGHLLKGMEQGKQTSVMETALDVFASLGKKKE